MNKSLEKIKYETLESGIYDPSHSLHDELFSKGIRDSDSLEFSDPGVDERGLTGGMNFENMITRRMDRDNEMDKALYSTDSRGGSCGRGGLMRYRGMGSSKKQLHFLQTKEKTASHIGKPDGIIALEKILSANYTKPVEITRIDDMLMTRKQVKRIYFAMEDSIYQVWVFKADPKQTAKELAIYEIAFKKGLPTPRPLFGGKFANDYPYDIAILGGIVEHAGDSYDSLLENLRLTPNFVFRTAESIGDLITRTHKVLTESIKDLEERGIVLERASPRKELRERMLPVLKLEDREVEPLIRLSEELYDLQRGKMVVSHGDLHTGNVVTQIADDDQSLVLGTSIKKFGLIDFGSITLDYEQGDFADFWIHHERKARSIIGESYNYAYNNFRRAKEESLNDLVQCTLWHLYEMFDPTRKEKIYEKAAYHIKNFRENMDEISIKIPREYEDHLTKRLNAVLAKTEYRELLKVK